MGHGFLIRMGGNVWLLTKLAYYAREWDGGAKFPKQEPNPWKTVFLDPRLDATLCLRRGLLVGKQKTREERFASRHLTVVKAKRRSGVAVDD